MHWNDGFIAVDWGTTNRRAYLVGPTGQVIDQVQDELGILNVPSGTFAAAAMQLRTRLGAYPLLLAGMIGSNLGWKLAPYVRCPAGLADLKQAICWVESDIAIVPGVSFKCEENADIMRGEELQVLGAAAAGIVPPDSMVCHPGTHTKWVQVAGARIVGFKTAMTGELFGLLRKHSILSADLQKPVQDGPQFAAGVSRSLKCTDLLAELFRVRARAILDPPPGAMSGFSAFVSGLLIGSDVREAAMGLGNNPISVAGEPHLTALYAKALSMAGHMAVEIDGAKAFLAGAKALVEIF
jgi:2-dehydro-3-deoxygalactonokinase